MIENIKNFDYDKYKNEVEQFLIDKGCVDDGHASERVVEIIKNYIEGK
jgi:CDP-glycerol glycerophosphotransferase